MRIEIENGLYHTLQRRLTEHASEIRLSTEIIIGLILQPLKKVLVTADLALVIPLKYEYRINQER